MDSERRPGDTNAFDVVVDLRGLDTAELRAQRDRCRSEERRLSYTRRMLQGHLDLADAELVRRHQVRTETLVNRVARALVGPSRGSPSLRAVGLYAPTQPTEDLDDVTTVRVPDLDDAALAAHVDDLRRRERALSDRRADLLGHLDRLQAALVERYRDGRAGIDEVAVTLDTG